MPSGNGIGASGGTRIAEALRHNCTLTSLNFRSMEQRLGFIGHVDGPSVNRIGTTGVTQMAEALERNSALKSLDVRGMEQRLELMSGVDGTSENQFGAQGGTRMAEALERNSTLTSLNISGMEEIPRGSVLLMMPFQAVQWATQEPSEWQKHCSGTPPSPASISGVRSRCWSSFPDLMWPSESNWRERSGSIREDAPAQHHAWYPASGRRR